MFFVKFSVNTISTDYPKEFQSFQKCLDTADYRFNECRKEERALPFVHARCVALAAALELCWACACCCCCSSSPDVESVRWPRNDLKRKEDFLYKTLYLNQIIKLHQNIKMFRIFIHDSSRMRRTLSFIHLNQFAF